MCFLTRYNKKLSTFKSQFAIIGLISNFIYLIYPAGVGWYVIHPLSYRVIQTLLFHGLMSMYGIITLIYDDVKFEWKKSYKELIIIIILTIWALVGNYLYNGIGGNYNYKFNWFFVIRDPFNTLPSEISKLIMPPFMIIFMYCLVMLVYFIYYNVRKNITKKEF